MSTEMINLEAYETERNAPVAPAEKVPEATTPAAPATPEGQQAAKTPPPASEPAEKQEQQEPEQKQPEQPEDEAKKKGGFQRRIDRLTRERAELAARVQQLESAGAKPADQTPSAPAAAGSPKPNVEQFENYEAYVEALTLWQAKQIIEGERKAAETAKAKTEAEARVKKFTEQAKAIAARHDDFDDVVEAAAPDMTPAIKETILESDHGAELAYHLGTHPETLARIAALPPLAAARELGKLEAIFTPKAPEQKAAPSKAPAPIKPAAPTATTAPAYRREMTMEEYNAWRDSGGGQ